MIHQVRPGAICSVLLRVFASCLLLFSFQVTNRCLQGSTELHQCSNLSFKSGRLLGGPAWIGKYILIQINLPIQADNRYQPILFGRREPCFVALLLMVPFVSQFNELIRKEGHHQQCIEVNRQSTWRCREIGCRLR